MSVFLNNLDLPKNTTIQQLHTDLQQISTALSESTRPITTTGITCSGAINASGNINGSGNINATGNVNASGTIVGSIINSSGAITALGNINGSSNINATGNVNASGTISSSAVATTVLFTDYINGSQLTPLLTALKLLASPLNHYMYLADECTIWTNATSYTGITATTGNTIDNDSGIKYPTNDANGKYVLRSSNFNVKQIDGSGIIINVPLPPIAATYDYTVLWVQLLNNRDSTFKIYKKNSDNTFTTFGKFGTSIRRTNNITPSGSTQTDRWDLFEWYPIPIKLNTDRKILISNWTPSETWLSGFAFSTNPWNHLRLSPLSIYWQSNIDDTSIAITNTTYFTWYSTWNNESMVSLNANQVIQMRIPFINSGRNKVFYIVGFNDTWGEAVTDVSILFNGTYYSLGGVYTSRNNPFATHFNSVMYQKYFSIVIPINRLPTYTGNDLTSTYFITIRITTPYENGGYMWIKEVGTHDEIPPIA